MKIKKSISIAIAVGIIGTMGIAYASTAKTPAEVASELTGKPASELYTQRSEGKTYGTIAKDAGKLDEFKAQMLDQRKIALDQMVKDGKLTQERADEIYNSVKTNQATCDATGSARKGQGCGMGNSGAGRGKMGGCGNNQGSCRAR